MFFKIGIFYVLFLLLLKFIIWAYGNHNKRTEGLHTLLRHLSHRKKLGLHAHQVNSHVAEKTNVKGAVYSLNN